MSKKGNLIFAMLPSVFVTASTDLLAAEKLKHRCPTKVPGIEVRIVGQHGDLIEIHYTKNKKFYAAYKENLAEMGTGALTFMFSKFCLEISKLFSKRVPV